MPQQRGGSARPVNKNNPGIIQGSSHGITTQVPPKSAGIIGGSQKKRGESPVIKTNNFVASGNGGSSKK